MKKQVIAAVLGLSMFALPVFAQGNDDNNGKHKGEDRGLKLGVFKNFFGKFEDSQFVVSGTVDSVGTNSFVVKANAMAHVSNVTNSLVTIKTDANTKIGTPVAVAQNVVVTGTISNTDLLATNVKLIGPKPVVKKETAVGKVTAKTATSVTITNTLTNTSKTITTDADTKVKIDGEVKTVADINVGDSGWIRFKTVGTTLVAKVMHLFR